MELHEEYFKSVNPMPPKLK